MSLGVGTEPLCPCCSHEPQQKRAGFLNLGCRLLRSGPSRELKIAAMGQDIRRLPDGPSQLHRDPAVSLGSEMNMVGL